MSPESFAELVDYLEDRFSPGRMSAWAAAPRLLNDYASFPDELVWECLLTKLDADTKAEWPPTPPALRAAVLERLRYQGRPALPETTERYGWAQYSLQTYGKVISLREAVELVWRRRAGG